MSKMKSGGSSLNGPDAADEINNSIVLSNFQVLCFSLSWSERVFYSLSKNIQANCLIISVYAIMSGILSNSD